MESGLLVYYLRTLAIVVASSIIVEGVQEFVIQPQDVSVIKRQTAVLKCSVRNRVGPIQWAKNGIMLGGDRSIPGFPRYSIIGETDQDFNLQIEDANLDDDAEYECQVGPSQNQLPLKAKANLTVLVPPNMPEIVNHTNGSVIGVPYPENVQSPLVLKCLATHGRPAAVIKWIRDGAEVKDGVTYGTEPIANDKRENAHSTLVLYPKYPQDNNARYICSAKNDALLTGPLQVMVNLSVQFPPGAPKISGYHRNQPVKVNDTIHMLCTSEGGNPLAQVVWYRNNERLDSSYKQRNNKVTNELVVRAQRSDNNAQFRCEAWNVVNQDNPHVATRNLVVHFAPTFVNITGTREAKAGETLTLTCTSSSSNPAADIVWIPHGSPIVHAETTQQPGANNGMVTVSKVDVTLTADLTSAIYICTATNKNLSATVSANATVGVLYPPDSPEITGYEEGQAVTAGEDVLELTCIARRGNPPATIEWYMGDDLMPAEDVSFGNIPAFKLTVALKPKHNGVLFKCTASNKATEVPKSAVRKVTVNFPPAYVRITSFPAQPRAGNMVRLTCISASSNPAAVLYWYHNNEPLQGQDMGLTDAEWGGKSTTNVLKIVPASSRNAIYGCRAKNSAVRTTINDDIILNVLFKPNFTGLDQKIVIHQSQSRVINLTADANPPEVAYILKKEDVVVTSFTLMMTEGLLTISSITKFDQGLYSLEATNTEGMSTFNFTIDVLYAAVIVDKTPAEGMLGETVELRCAAEANPMVANMITWSRSGFDMTRTFSTYDNGVGTLRVEELQKMDTGSFTCTADNKISPPTESAVDLTVSFKPSIDKSREFTKAASETGKTGELKCTAEGYPKVTFTWEKEGVAIYSNGNKYVIEEKVDPQSSIMYQSILLVKDVQPQDYGIYECLVSNSKGTDRIHIQFDVTRRPDPPYDIQFVNATHNSITIKWKKAFNGGLTQYFRVRYRRLDMDQGYTQVDVIPEDSTIFTVRGLALGTEYEFTVMSHNLIGGSDYQPKVCTAKTSNLKPKSEDASLDLDSGDDTTIIIILVVCVVGIFLLALNIGLILHFVRKRRKRMENGSDTTSHTNTIELYGPSKETALYPMTPSDESRSYGTCDKNDDDFSDDYKSYEDDDIKRVFLPPPEYGSVTYSHNKLDSPTFDHRLPVHTEVKHPYNGSDRSDTDSCRKSPWQYDDPYRPTYRGKGTFDSDYADQPSASNYYEHNGKAGGGRADVRPKSITELSERSSRPSSRGGYKTPPPPPVRSSSKGATDIPPLPARNYGEQDIEPRYVPPPGTLSSFNNNVNVITNPSYEGPSIRTPSPRHQTDPADDMRGHLV